MGTFVNTEGGGERQVGTVAPLLIPTLDSRADRARGDGEVERPGDLPLVRDLPLETKDFGLVEFEFPTDGLELIRVLCDQGALFEVPYVLGEALFFHERFDVGEELVPGDAGEGVLDLGLEVGRQIRLVDGIGVVRAVLCVRCCFILRAVLGQQE